MMKEMMKEMMMKKKGEKMDPSEKSAKLDILKEIRAMAMGEMGEDVKGLKKVSVMAKDEAGLEKGLDKAKEMIGDEKECAACDKAPCECEAEDDMDSEEIEAMIAALQAKKAKRESK